MPSDNQISPLFDNVPPSSSGNFVPVLTPKEPIPDRSNSLLDALSQPAPIAPVTPPLESVFGNSVPVAPGVSELSEISTSDTLPEVPIDTGSSLFAVSESSETDTLAALPEKGESILSQPIIAPELSPISTLPEISLNQSEEPIPLSETLPEVSNSETSLPETDISPLDRSSSSVLENSSTKNLEKIEMEDSPNNSSTGPSIPDLDSKLDDYLQADSVYQAMIRIESQEKIRLQLAIRYTLLMFAIFLVLAWIVSNRVIMFGFSEFVWLARIRDGLFAVMAGLFALTLWFGSVSWTRNIFLVALVRTLALIFFLAVLAALYIPFW